MLRRALLITTAVAALGAAALVPHSTSHAEGTPTATATPTEIDAAIRRGVEHLVATQKKDGSWGSPAPTLYLDIYAPVPGSYPAFQVAVSAMAVSALTEVGGDVPGAADALRKGTDFLLAHHAVKRVANDTIYNVWSHAYALEAFARLLAREKDETRRAALKKGAEEAVALLERYESVDGGWGYYDDYLTKRPGHWTTSFATGSGLVALKMAADQGIAVAPKLVARGIRVLDICRFPNNAFAYAIDHRYYPHGGINKVKGSLARTPACLLATDLWRDDKVSLDHFRKALDDLERYGHFLLIARKYPYPHEAWYANSGYFCFYGYYYASQVVQRLPEAERPARGAEIAKHLLPLQEKDGSWWDYQLYGYHKPYGTAYVLMTLARCR